MKNTVKIVLFLLLLTVFTSCSLIATGNRSTKKRIVIKGSTTMLYLVQNWAEQFMKEHPGVSIYVEGGGSHVGIESLIKGDADLAAVSRTWQTDEIKELVREQGSLGISILTARDALSIYLNPQNPVQNLSTEQLKQIFTGKVSNWREVGGPDQKIVVVNRTPNSGTFAFFETQVLLGQPYSDDAVLLSTTTAVTKYVSTNPWSIGYGGMAYGKNLRHCRVNGVDPTPQNVRNGSYPISRYLRLYTVKRPDGGIKTFIDWVLSGEGQKIVQKMGYIPLYE